MPIGTVAEIWRYPVSSAGGERLLTASLFAEGVAGDRVWCMVDPATGEVAAPEKRKRWRPAPSLLARGSEELELRSGGGPWLRVPGPEATGLLERHFGFPVELRRAIQGQGEGTPDQVKPRYSRAPIHLLTTASLGELSGRVPGSAVDPRRFRPNLLIETGEGGTGFLEQGWIGRELRVGTAQLRVREPCTRCAFTVIAQQELGLEPVILAEITGAAEGAFGVLCDVVSPGQVEVGAGIELA